MEPKEKLIEQAQHFAASAAEQSPAIMEEFLAARMLDNGIGAVVSLVLIMATTVLWRSLLPKAKTRYGDDRGIVHLLGGLCMAFLCFAFLFCLTKMVMIHFFPRAYLMGELPKLLGC